MSEHPTDAHFLFTFVFKQALSQAAMKRFYESGYFINTACKIGRDTITKAAISKIGRASCRERV